MVIGSPTRRDPNRRRVHRAHRVHRRAYRGIRAADRGGQVVHPIRPFLARAIREAGLFFSQRCVAGCRVGGETTVEVQGVEEGQADTGVGGCCRQRDPHRVGIVVGAPAGTVVDIVELAHHTDARHGHLCEGCPGKSVIVVGIEAGSDPVHKVAPGPERAPLTLSAAP